MQTGPEGPGGTPSGVVRAKRHSFRQELVDYAVSADTPTMQECFDEIHGMLHAVHDHLLDNTYDPQGRAQQSTDVPTLESDSVSLENSPYAPPRLTPRNSVRISVPQSNESAESGSASAKQAHENLTIKSPHDQTTLAEFLKSKERGHNSPHSTAADQDLVRQNSVPALQIPRPAGYEPGKLSASPGTLFVAPSHRPSSSRSTCQSVQEHPVQTPPPRPALRLDSVQNLSDQASDHQSPQEQNSPYRVWPTAKSYATQRRDSPMPQTWDRHRYPDDPNPPAWQLEAPAHDRDSVITYGRIGPTRYSDGRSQLGKYHIDSANPQETPPSQLQWTSDYPSTTQVISHLKDDDRPGIQRLDSGHAAQDSTPYTGSARNQQDPQLYATLPTSWLRPPPCTHRPSPQHQRSPAHDLDVELHQGYSKGNKSTYPGVQRTFSQHDIGSPTPRNTRHEISARRHASTLTEDLNPTTFYRNGPDRLGILEESEEEAARMQVQQSFMTTAIGFWSLYQETLANIRDQQQKGIITDERSRALVGHAEACLRVNIVAAKQRTNYDEIDNAEALSKSRERARQERLERNGVWFNTEQDGAEVVPEYRQSIVQGAPSLPVVVSTPSSKQKWKTRALKLAQYLLCMPHPSLLTIDKAEEHTGGTIQPPQPMQSSRASTTTSHKGARLAGSAPSSIRNRRSMQSHQPDSKRGSKSNAPRGKRHSCSNEPHSFYNSGSTATATDLYRNAGITVPPRHPMPAHERMPKSASMALSDASTHWPTPSDWGATNSGL